MPITKHTKPHEIRCVSESILKKFNQKATASKILTNPICTRKSPKFTGEEFLLLPSSLCGGPPYPMFPPYLKNYLYYKCIIMHCKVISPFACLSPACRQAGLAKDGHSDPVPYGAGEESCVFICYLDLI
ncbi:MAG: hypothetical protein WC242_00580 [Candidatus Paceibacterota bacterium]